MYLKIDTQVNWDETTSLMWNIFLMKTWIEKYLTQVRSPT